VIGPPVDESNKLEQQKQLRLLAEEIRSELLDLRPVPPQSPLRRIFAKLFQPKGSAVSGADISAERPYEISVEVAEDALRQFGLSLRGFAQTIRQHNIEVPGGKMETASQELLLRGNNKREMGDEIAEIPILTRPNGDVITIDDIANVIDGFAETDSSILVNGRPGLVLQVSKTNDEDLFTIVETVRNYVAEKKVPDGYKLDTWGDISVDVRDRMELLTRNGLQGLMLVFLVLALFLDLRLAFWVAMGIPVSILGAGFVLLATGQTLNMLTMFAFLMALGIVVDDAIVIGENIYAKREEGMSYVKAAVEGTIEVLPSVCASVLTTVIAFMPLLFVTGVMGKFIAVMPVAVIAMLIISLVESTFILPCHLAHHDNLFLKIVSLIFYVFKPFVAVFAYLNKKATAWLTWQVESVYRPALEWSLNHKSITLSIATAAFMMAIGLVLSGIAPLAFFPKIDGREISATIAFPNGTASNFASDATRQLRTAFEEIDAEIQQELGHSVVKNVYELVGQIGNALGGPTGVTNGGHVGSVEVQLIQPDQRPGYTTQDLIKMWRERVPKIAGTEVLKFGSRSMGPGGTAVELKLLATDNSTQYLDAAAQDVKQYLASKKGVTDIEDDSRLGKQELVLRLNEQGRALGLDESSLAETIRAVYFGEEVMRLQRGRHEVKLMVRYPKDSRTNMESFENIRIRDNSGTEWPLKEVAEIEYKHSPSEINRLNQRRSITITADVDEKQANAVLINQEMQNEALPKIINDYKKQYGATLAVNWEGEQAQTMESIVSMFVGFGIALLCMFIVLTLEFKSYIQPVIIMAIIPFGWLGAVLGHALLRLNLTLFSFFGLIALTGVIVNDSIVLVDFINRRVREGMPLRDALVAAGVRRFRPIMLTSLTTIAGLFPMLLERSLQAQVLIPMAASLIFGLATGTILILFLVPIFYQIYGNVVTYFNMPLYHDDDDRDERPLVVEDVSRIPPSESREVVLTRDHLGPATG
jgi:multidrug efflux pump subunit AcrB